MKVKFRSLKNLSYGLFLWALALLLFAYSVLVSNKPIENMLPIGFIYFVLFLLFFCYEYSYTYFEIGDNVVCIKKLFWIKKLGYDQISKIHAYVSKNKFDTSFLEVSFLENNYNMRKKLTFNEKFVICNEDENSVASESSISLTDFLSRLSEKGVSISKE